jgi:CMP-2-keto-3-deoxyoctulosonic acid synthetase
MLSEMPETIATCFGPALVVTRPTISGGNSACISRGTLSVLYFQRSFIPFTFDTFRMCSFFCHAVR